MPKESLPTNSQWSSIQGGNPTILANEASTVFEIVHIYEKTDNDLVLPNFSEELSEKYTHYGSVVITPVIQIANSVKYPFRLSVGVKAEPVIVPGVLLINAHGNPCSHRSGSGRESSYDKIRKPNDWQSYLEKRTNNNWDVWSVVDQNGVLKLKLKGLLKNLV